MSGNIETISLWAYLSSDSTQTILDKLCLYGFPTSGSYKSQNMAFKQYSKL